MESEVEKGVGKNEKKTSGPIKRTTKKKENRDIKKRVSRNSQQQRTNYLQCRTSAKRGRGQKAKKMKIDVD